VTKEVVSAAYRLCDDGVRRWEDLDIADWLGLKRPRSIRHSIIERHRREMERHGTLQQIVAKSRGGRQASEYRLNFKQAMVACTHAHTAMAEDVRTIMIEVFEEVVIGVSTVSRMQQRAIEAPAQQLLKPLLDHVSDHLRPLVVEVDHVKQRQDRIEIKVDNFIRKPFTKSVRANHRAYIRRCGGLCPCCMAVPLWVNSQWVNYEEDHWYNRGKRGQFQTWIICRECNRRLEHDSEYKRFKTPMFEAYVQGLCSFLSIQGRLF
jgi:hypothetical protein